MMERLLTFGFGDPWMLLALLLLPLAAWLEGKRRRTAAVRYSAVSLVRTVGGGVLTRPGRWRKRARLFALLLLLLALARPHIEQGSSNDRKEGVDIVFAVDVSGSMDEKDFSYKEGKISRLDALIMAIGDFVDKRPNDRFGMVGFAGNTYLMSPLTLDGEWIKNVLKGIKTQGGTAVGDGIAAGVNLLKEAPGKSKVVVVATDGESNTGMAPLKAADIAKAANVRVHALHIISLKQVSATNATKNMLGKVAEKTGGLYFQAATLESVLDVYRQIDKMEKSKFEQRHYRVYEELYPWFTLGALLLLLFLWIGENTLWLRLP